MAMRPPIYNTADFSSAVATTRGTALAAQQATMDLVPSKNKREQIRLTAFSTGATPSELLILQTPSFRVRTVQSSTTAFAGSVSYHSGTTRNVFHFEGGVTNIDGTLTLLGTTLITKYGAGLAAVAITTDNPSESIIITGTGVAGDTNGRWEAFITNWNAVTEDARP
jgi:hypothetical protein